MLYLTIAIKIIVGMLGVLFFLRISGKTQMAQLTPLDSVNAFVLGALVGGVIYSAEVSVWELVFSLAMWTAFNMFIRYLLRFKALRRVIKGDTVMIVSDGHINLKEFKRNGLEMEQFRTLLRENGIFSMFEVDDVRFETNGQLTVSTRNSKSESYLFVNNGSILQSSLENAGKTEEWLRDNLTRLGYTDVNELFCVEWTPRRGFYVVAKGGGDNVDGQDVTIVCN
nr:YetF domain-containing protein [uncultured Bacteroides sp.]